MKTQMFLCKHSKKKKTQKQTFYPQSSAPKQGMVSVGLVAVLSVANIFRLWLLKHGLVWQMDSEKWAT